jgi:flagellar basal-body rod protein FlgG
MLAQEHNLDAIANNLANMDQTGFKRDTAVFKSFPEMLLRRTNDDGQVWFPLGSYDRMPVVGAVGTGVEVNDVFTEFEQGAHRTTGNPFDFALEGRGFFTVETKDGVRYTRNGSFLIDKDSYLVTKDGSYVLGENGRIQVKANNFSVNEQGDVTVNMDLQNQGKDRLVSYAENDWSDTRVIDRLLITDFRQPRGLKKEGNSYYRPTEEALPVVAARDAKVQQGFLEMANVNPVREMTRMIEVQRIYEANQRVLQTHDSELGKLINEVGRVG